jgi:ABC-type sugar transport system ATPase subunit
VGARAEIYGVLARIAERGAGIVISSSDALELMGMCHRILVLSEGTIVREFTKDNVTEEELVRSQFLSSHANGGSVDGPRREGGTRVWS